MRPASKESVAPKFRLGEGGANPTAALHEREACLKELSHWLDQFCIYTSKGMNKHADIAMNLAKECCDKAKLCEGTP